MSQSYKSVADILNAFSVGVFPVKSKPGKNTVRFTDTDGKRKFLDRKQIQDAQGQTVWAWVVGKEITQQAAQPAAPSITVA